MEQSRSFSRIKKFDARIDENDKFEDHSRIVISWNEMFESRRIRLLDDQHYRCYNKINILDNPLQRG